MRRQLSSLGSFVLIDMYSLIQLLGHGTLGLFVVAQTAHSRCACMCARVRSTLQN